MCSSFRQVLWIAFFCWKSFFLLDDFFDEVLRLLREENIAGLVFYSIEQECLKGAIALEWEGQEEVLDGERFVEIQLLYLLYPLVFCNLEIAMAGCRNRLSYAVPALLDFCVAVVIADDGDMGVGEAAVHAIDAQDFLDVFRKLVSADVYDIYCNIFTGVSAACRPASFVALVWPQVMESVHVAEIFAQDDLVGFAFT